MSPPPAQDNVAQLKNDIDTGSAAHNAASADPGLSPLGTDDEAGGHPLTPEQISLARRQESANGALAGKDDHSSKGISILLMGGVFAVLIIVVVAFLLMRG